ncbi:MAG: AAA family ATPase, partial [Gaiellaceae bacterium]
MERKLATVLFVDLVDSTGLVTGADPEVVRRRVQTYFERVSRCVTAHGGIVEKFAGDAVMAAFGIPQAHEDDAERAVRAGLAILDAVHELELEARIGVESGEVVADDSDSTFATGEAVTVAARLEQSAEPGQLLIGPGAHRLTLGRVEVDDVGPVELKGLGDQVWTWLVLGASAAPERPQSQQAPLVGRVAELDLLQNTYDRALRDRRAHLFTMYGEPGVGKSRLAHEFSQALEGATVLSGRSLPYGEGVTYWPLAEMVKCAAGIVDDDPLDVAIEKLRSFCEDEVVADLLGLASGVLEAVQAERSQQEIAWAGREWAQRLAQEQPLVLVFEDIHWAEGGLLDLIETLASLLEHAPVLLLTMARPDLLDSAPGWGSGLRSYTALALDPLNTRSAEELALRLLGRETLNEHAARLAQTSEGNPLFIEELAASVSEHATSADGKLPTSVRNIIAARLDALPERERAVVLAASAIGKVFWAGAVARLHSDPQGIHDVLDSLERRDLLRRESVSRIAGD